MKAHLTHPNKALIRISACMIAKNEAENIGKCIDSVKDFADEIVVLDTGSSDKTVEIAKEHGAEVGYFEWCSDFAAAKNAALDLVNGDWIVFLDADEYFSPHCGDKVREAIRIAEGTGKNAVGCRMINLDSDNGKEIVENFTVRIFKSGIHYVFAVHEEPTRPEGIMIASVEKSWFVIYHTGYTVNLMPQKSRRNLEIMLKEIEKEGVPRRKYSYYCYMSDSYFSLKNYEKSIEYAKLYLEKANEFNIVLLGLATVPYLNIIKSLEASDGSQDELEYWINRLAEKYPEYPDVAFARARLHLRQHRHRLAKQEFIEAVELSEKYNGIDLNHIPSQMVEIYAACGQCDEALYNIPDAITNYYKAFELKNEAVQPLYRLLSLLKNLNGQELDNFVEKLYKDGDIEKHLHVMAALMTNYMYDQLLRCYAAYKNRSSQHTLDGQVTAFLLASKGEFAKASAFFIKAYMVTEDKNSIIRALLCAYLSNSKELIGNSIVGIAPKGALEALGLHKRVYSFDAVEEYSDLYTELSRMGHFQRVLNFISELGDAGELFLLKLAEALEYRYCFDGALQAIRLCPLTGKALMLGGYYAYRLAMYSYSRDCFDAARYENYSAPGLADLEHELNDRVNSTINRRQDLNQLIQNISSAIESDPAKALELIRQYKLLDADNPEINSAECVINYQMGLYHDAAVNVLGALERCGAVFDLHYNAYCIFDKMGDTSRAASHLKQAIELCSAEETRAELMEELSALNRQDLQK